MPRRRCPAASIRQQFSIPENIRLSQFTLGLFRRLKEEFGADADIGFRENGYLILSTDEGLPVLRANHAAQQAEGADIVIEDAAGARPPLSLAVAGGHRGRRVRPHAAKAGSTRMPICSSSAGRCRTKKIDFINASVTGIERDGNRLTAVLLDNGERLEAGIDRQRRRAERRQGLGACRHRAAGRAAQALASSSSRRATNSPTCR